MPGGPPARFQVPGTLDPPERAGRHLALPPSVSRLANYRGRRQFSGSAGRTGDGAHPMAPIETILLAIDGSPASEPASEQAIDLATQVEARLLVVSVLGPSSRPSEAPAALARWTTAWAFVVSESRESATAVSAGASDGRDEVPRTLTTRSRASTWVARSIACSLAGSDAGEPSIASSIVSMGAIGCAPSPVRPADPLNCRRPR